MSNRARTPADKALKADRSERRKVARSGRPVGARNERPREKRVLTPVQKLREHILIELGVDKKDIADAIGETRQTVSNVFFDLHRSDCEAKIIEFLRERFYTSDRSTQRGIERLIDSAEPITREALGWPEKAGAAVCGKSLGHNLSCVLEPGHERSGLWCSAT